ncbi:hypothetical protein HRH25_12675 [Flavisolibacter sp. BT320]|nr:hypothetical protein [Flavisolibacter longurius]
MKRLLTILLTTSCPILLMAQTEGMETPKTNDKTMPPIVPQDKATPDETLQQNDTDYSTLRPKNLQPGVNRLPLDGTPCIVPDADKTVPMPNAWKGPLRVPFKKKKPAASYNETANSPVLF